MNDNTTVPPLNINFYLETFTMTNKQAKRIKYKNTYEHLQQSFTSDCLKKSAVMNMANRTVQPKCHTVPLLQACIVLILIDKRHLDSILGIASVFQNSQLIHPHTSTPLSRPSSFLALSMPVTADA